MSTIIGPFGIRQGADAGVNFDGSAPSTVPVVTSKRVKFVNETAPGGGLFNFATQLTGITFHGRRGGLLYAATMDLVVLGYRIRLGEPTTWSMSTVDSLGDEVTIDSETGVGDTDHVYGGEEFVLPAGVNLKLVTAGASKVQHCTVTVVPYLYHRGI